MEELKKGIKDESFLPNLQIEKEEKEFLTKKEKKQIIIGAAFVLFVFLVYLMIVSTTKYGMHQVTIFGYQKSAIIKEYFNVNDVKYNGSFVCFEKEGKNICVSGSIEVTESE